MNMQTEHTSSVFDAELETVRACVMQMGGLVEEQVVNAVDSLVKRRLDLCDLIVIKDKKVDGMQIKIDSTCAQIIARRQPTAVDLRMLMAVIKTVAELERIGNEAKKIACLSKQIYHAQRLSVPRFSEIKLMSGLVLCMLRQSLDAFARLDSGAATKIPRHDTSVDESYDKFMNGLIHYMMENPRAISSSLEVLFAAKAIERIGDHAKNLSGHVVYLVEGIDMRHESLPTIERQTERIIH